MKCNKNVLWKKILCAVFVFLFVSTSALEFCETAFARQYAVQPKVEYKAGAPAKEKPNTNTKDRADKVKDFVELLKKQIGKPYASRCTVPQSFDNGSFVQYALKKSLKIKVSKSVKYQSARLLKKYKKEKVSLSDLKTGDVIFFYDLTTDKKVKKIGHVGVYIGDSKFIHASSAKGKVIISKLDDIYKDRFAYGIRIIK